MSGEGLMVLPAPCPTCGVTLVDKATAAEHYLTGCVPPSDCEKCGVPLPFSQASKHIAHCIGQQPHVLHNRKAGMVAYLTEEEWEALRSGALSSEQADQVVGRAVYGIEFETVDLSEKD